MKTEEILGLVNVIFYIAHIIVFSILGYKHNKKGGLKSASLILIFLFVLLFISLQVGGFLAQFFFIGREMTTKLKAVHDTIVITIATVIQAPIWYMFLKKKEKNDGENKNDSIDSPR